MKRMTLVLTIVLVLLCSCAPAPTDETSALSLSYRGVELTVGMPADEASAALGED